jgi:Zn-dependent protease with chaperone function
MDFFYPPGPTGVPADLTKASPVYKRHAWFAVAGLLAFVALYFGLLGWLIWTAYRLLSSLGHAGSNVVMALLVGGFSAFLALFMAKALVFIKRGKEKQDIEIKASEHPKLFAFLHRLADDAGAPRPHKVYVSPRVNAAVFYDLSLMNLLFPSKKNLEIGLGLVNVLNLGEFKAVLAHEFGHFAQRSMAVGRWVYTAQQVVGQIVEKRDALDAFLIGLSNVDLRVAWIGWFLRLIVWAIRSLVELVFRGVIIAQRALSREMEYQADLTAVALTGSDALVHALHRLNAADEAWYSALRFAVSEGKQGRAVADLFAVQNHVIDKLRLIRADELFGVAPMVPERGAAQHRVFRAALAQPPKMWSTHPANTDREANAKRVYLPAAIDTRSAWDLFATPEQLRARMSGECQRDLFDAKATLAATELAASLAELDKQFNRPSLHRRYRGAYLDRRTSLMAAHCNDLYAPELPASTSLSNAVAGLYPEAYGATLESLRELSEEHAALQTIATGRGSAAGGVLRWRGSDVKKRELPKVLKQLTSEIKSCQSEAFGFGRARWTGLATLSGKLSRATAFY